MINYIIRTTKKILSPPRTTMIKITKAVLVSRQPEHSVFILDCEMRGVRFRAITRLRATREDSTCWQTTIEHYRHGIRLVPADQLPMDVQLEIHDILDKEYKSIVEYEMERLSTKETA